AAEQVVERVGLGEDALEHGPWLLGVCFPAGQECRWLCPRASPGCLWCGILAGLLGLRYSAKDRSGGPGPLGHVVGRDAVSAERREHNRVGGWNVVDAVACEFHVVHRLSLSVFR